jgi:hypothetical protein
MVDKKKNEATSVASPRASSRSRGQIEQDKITAHMQELVGKLSEILGDQFVKMEVEPVLKPVLKPDKKKLN